MMKHLPAKRSGAILIGLGLGLAANAEAQTSRKMTEIAHLRLSQTGNAGIWGYVAPDGTEYALPTTRSGTAIVSLKNPRAPKELHHLTSPQGTWHELLTVGDHLYKCADQGTAGLQIYDLRPLPAAPRELPAYKGDGVVDCHTVWADTLVRPKRLYIESPGAVRILSLADPGKPVQIGSVRTQVHDGFARGGRLYVSTGGGNTMDIWDATNAAAPARLGRAMIGDISASRGEPRGYSHNVWLTDDGRYAFTTEETNGCTVKMWDLQDEKNPKFTGGTFLKGTGMAHNAYIRKHLLYLSHYGMGVRVIDFKDPKNLVEVAFHSPGGSSWGCYPWLPSGLIIHGNGGLRVVEPDADIKITGSGQGGTSQLSYAPVSAGTGGFGVAGFRGWGGAELALRLPGAGGYDLAIFGAGGREVFRTAGAGVPGTQAVRATPLAPGRYWVRLAQGGASLSAPLQIAP